MEKMQKIFNTDKRIKLGIWGLGRGMSFYQACKSLNIDVVAGCDYNQHMREGFLRCNPNAFATADADEFLKQDFDAVLLATFCPAHADDAIRCMRAGKHVLSEVTSFHTMAEGVRLVEEVEKSGKIYNLAENYPFTKNNMYLARKWQEGLFGDLMYAEFEYVHECRSLAYTYIDGKPIQPGNTLHSWRSWLNFHYYCTHSLGPIMIITGTRPTRVVSLPGKQALAGYPMELSLSMGMGGIAPSLISMSNGAVVRNLMGATTNDTHQQRIWGTLASAEAGGEGLFLRLGGSGSSPRSKIIAQWDDLGILAEKGGHGGGDFWILYYFARQILTGEKAPFDIYSACDVTIPGILALRSSVENGKPFDVPDFRNKSERDAWRNDNWSQPRIKSNAMFPENADIKLTGQFTAIMKNLIESATTSRAFFDWNNIGEDVAPNSVAINRATHKFIHSFPEIVACYESARKLADAYPASEGARVINELLELGREKDVLAPSFRKEYMKKNADIGEVFPNGEVSEFIPGEYDIAKVVLPGSKTVFTPRKKAKFEEGEYFNVQDIHNDREGLIYLKIKKNMKKQGKAAMSVGIDAPFKIWVNGKEAACEPNATNPLTIKYKYNVSFKKGENEIIVAMKASPLLWGAAVMIS